MASPHQRNATSGCFSGVLRRILCKDGLPTHPSDDIPDSKPTHLGPTEKEPKKAEPVQAPATPGLVARLMGLESLPNAGDNRVPNGPDLVSRSRSVNFMDYMLKFDFAHQTNNQNQQQQHRRVRSSVSFREVPAAEQPGQVLVLYLNNVGETNKVPPSKKQRKSEVGSRDLKQRKQEQSRHARARAAAKKKEKVSKLKDEPRRVSVNRCSKRSTCNGSKDLDFVSPNDRKPRPPTKPKASTKSVSPKQAPVRAESPKKKRNNRDSSAVHKTEHEQCSSVDSSPVSVLDLDETPFSEYEIDNRGIKSPARITDKEYKFPIPTIREVEDAIKKDEADLGNQETECLMELRRKLCRLAEKDMAESNWSSKCEIEDVGVELGCQIFNQLIDQLVNELVLMAV